MGARVLAIARDYWRLVTGRLSGIEMAPREAKLEMKKHKNTRYDGEILDILLNAQDVGRPIYMDNTVSATSLKPGMVLGQNLYNDAHILILPEGHTFSESTISKLAQFERERGKKFTICLKKEEPETAEDVPAAG